MINSVTAHLIPVLLVGMAVLYLFGALPADVDYVRTMTEYLRPHGGR